MAVLRTSACCAYHVNSPKQTYPVRGKGGKVTICIGTDIGGNPVPAAAAAYWMPLNDPGQNPASGETSYGVDLDALGCVPGTFLGFKAHYVTGGGSTKVAEHWSEAVDLEIASEGCEWRNETAFGGDLPLSRPIAGHFVTYKGNELEVTVDGFDFFVIHLDLRICE